MNIKHFVRTIAPLTGLFLLSTMQAHAQSLLFWDFENCTSSGNISTAIGAPGVSGITGFMTQDGGGPAENIQPGGGFVFLTRFFGTYHPTMEFTLTKSMYVKSVTFNHAHNHNPGFPTYPNYYAQLQLDGGDGYTDIGAPLLLQGSNVYQPLTTMTINKALGAGTYHVRWDPRGLAYGSDTNTEYFALDNLSLDGNVVLSWSGVLQPVNPDGSSVFKAGSTIPIKFQLTGDFASNTTLPATLSFTKISNGIEGPVNESTSTSAATVGNLFRYDATSQTYIFNWSTKGLTAGTYRLYIDLGDNVTRTIDLGLR